MLKVLLVDDNRYALEYFSNLISWQDYGFELVGTALDGEFAYAQFLAHKPQVVITDIQMPNIDGIELSRKILQAAPETVVIFLSSYEEFKYAQSALQLGVSDYIIKHEVTKESLAQKLVSIRESILNNTQNLRYINEGNMLYLINAAEHACTDKFPQYAHKFPEQYDLCILVQDHIYPELDCLSTVPETEITENELKNYLYQYPQVTAVVRVKKFTYVLLLNSSHSFYETATPVIHNFYTTFQTTASVILCAENTSICNCFDNYFQVLENIDRKYFFLPSSILYKDVFLASSSVDIRVPTEEMRRLSASRKFDSLCGLLQENFQSAILRKDIRSFGDLTRTAAAILQEFREKITYVDAPSLFDLSPADARTYWYDASSIFHWIMSQFGFLSQFYQENMPNTSSNAVNDVLLYIHQNYPDSELSVESIAAHFNINMNQLNYLFKKNLGETVIKCLIRVRMEKAKKLLDENNLRISEIGKAVGYNSTSYFSNVFKKYYGSSPQDYRRTTNENHT